VAIFAVVHRVILNPLPYGDSSRLLSLDFAIPSRNIPSFGSMPTRLYYHYLDRSSTLGGLAFYRRQELTLTGQGSPQRIGGLLTAPSLPSVLRVPPARGRWFTDNESLPGAPPVAVLSHGTWTRRYGQDPGVLGRQVTVDNVARTIVGVMPPSFAFPDADIEIWMPMPLTRASATDAFMVALVGRLRDGATVDGARNEFDRLNRELGEIHAGNGYEELRSRATTLIEARVGRVSNTLWILLAAVLLVLLIACANVANLILIRSEERQREVAVRRALGASGRAIARYVLSESAMLSFAAGTGGLFLAWGAVRLLVAYGPTNLPRLEEIRLDGAALAFAGALSLLSAAALGAIPLLRLPAAVPLLESGRSNTAGRRRHHTRQLLMGTQIALALVLLVSSGLMVRSFQNLRAIDPGFDAVSAMTFRIGLPRTDYPDTGKMIATHRAIIDRLASVPGVASVSAATCLPLQGCQGGPLFVRGRVLPPGANPPIVLFHAIAGDYFDTIRTPVVRGSGITRGDVERKELVVVVNEALARIAFPDEDPIGQRVRLGTPARSSGPAEWHTIAGVVANTPTLTLTDPSPVPKLYFPLVAPREGSIAPRVDAMNYVLRTTVAPLGLTEAVRSAVADIDANLAVAQVGTLEDMLERAASQMAFAMVLLAIAAAVALILGVIGIYGAMSYIVSQRTGEIGLRVALGAEPRSVAAMIVRQGGFVALAGIGIGLAAAMAATRFVESLLYGVSPRDPAVFVATTTLLIVVAVCACWVPARRAARLNPVEALRAE
jgi:putative ABC transport system permease protein